ncbi:MAG: LPS assembly protein LptD [Deltaproteobacteria bacterium]|nr:LPS assembly protein LptD [Deltaproteobacteria bacterium]
MILAAILFLALELFAEPGWAQALNRSGLGTNLTEALRAPETGFVLEDPRTEGDLFAPWPEDREYPGPFPEEAFPRAYQPLSREEEARLYQVEAQELPQTSNRVRMVVSQNGPEVVIEADEMRYDELSGRLDFIGQVLITREAEQISANRALWHEPTQTVEVSGAVKMRTPDFSATAARAAVNMDLKLAKLYDGKAFFPQGHYYVQGDVIERQGEEAFYVNEAVFTTCDGPDPSWRLLAKDLMINRGGLATATGVTLENKWFNLFYAPYFAVPIKGERQTGFLMPTVEYSKRDGFFLATPFFWELAEDYDLTITPVWRSHRGLAVTLEGRYNLSAGQGIWLVTALKDKQNNLYSYRSEGRQEKNVRNLYWLRTQNAWNYSGWNINLDLDLVSDPMYLYTFRSDLDGFNVSQALFSRYFGRTINEELDPIRQSTLYVQRTADDTYFKGSLNYSNNLYLKNNVDTLQNLPKLQYNIVSRPINLGFSMPGSLAGPRFSLELQYDYFSRKTDRHSYITEIGHRLTMAPSLFWNQDMGTFMNLKLDGGLRYTAYFPTGYRPTRTGRIKHEANQHIFSGNVDIELTTSLSRVYDFGPGQASQTQHEVSPILAFELVESPSQSEAPFFDMLDRRLSRQTFRYGLRNSITTKTPVLDASENLLYNDYKQIFKLGIYGSYEFANNIEWAENTWARYYTTGYYDSGVGPFELEIESNLANGVSTRLLSQFDGRAGKFTRHEISMSLFNRRGDSLGLIYDYDNSTISSGPAQENNVSQIRGDAIINFTGGWSSSFSTRFDFQRKKELETYFTLNYEAQCYAVSVFFSSTYDDQRVGLVFNLLGLGSFGTPSASLSSDGT